MSKSRKQDLAVIAVGLILVVIAVVIK